jgi:allantoinase
MKQGEDVFDMWGGIAGCQNGVELVCNRALERGVSLEMLSKKWRENVFARFGVKGSGIATGADADFFLLGKSNEEIGRKEQLSRHGLSPYIGMSREMRVTGTWLRGMQVDSKTRGRFLQPFR